MRRALRWSFTGAAAVSALLCAATCVLWERSYWPDWADPFAVRTFEGRGSAVKPIIPWNPDGAKVQFSNGLAYISWANRTNKPALPGSNGCVVDDGVRCIRWGGAYCGRQQLAGIDNYLVTFPLPVASVVFFVAPLWFFAARRKRVMRWLRGLAYSAYDGHGKLKFLLCRSSDVRAWLAESPPTAPETLEKALNLLCSSFDIPTSQRHCLRPDDDLMAIYKSKVGPRSCDSFEFERLVIELSGLPGPKLTHQDVSSLKTVGDVVRLAAARLPDTGEQIR